MTNANFQTAGDVLDGWRDDVLTGSPPVLYPIGAGDLGRIEIGPGLVTLIGGPPGTGKSAFAMQAVNGLRDERVKGLEPSTSSLGIPLSRRKSPRIHTLRFLNCTDFPGSCKYSVTHSVTWLSGRVRDKDCKMSGGGLQQRLLGQRKKVASRKAVELDNYQVWLAVPDGDSDFALRLRKGAGAKPTESSKPKESPHPTSL